MDRNGLLANTVASVFNDNKNVKILHYNASDREVKNTLAEKGFTNYLGVTVDAQTGAGDSGIYYVNDKNVLIKNNADVLVLGKCDVYDIKNAFNSSAQFIVCQPENLFDSLGSYAVWAYKYARKMKWEIQREEAAGAGRKGNSAIVFKRKFKREKKARYYLSPEVGYQNFFDALNGEELQYTVLRWHDKIPFDDINEDVDLLIADSDIEKVQELLNEKTGILPFDLYS